jgi:hypothetical protein
MDAATDAATGFLALICADEDLLRAEFEEIIAAGWGPPPLPDGGRRGEQGPGPAQRRTEAGAGPIRPAPRAAAGDGQTRQRSPPQPGAAGVRRPPRRAAVPAAGTTRCVPTARPRRGPRGGNHAVCPDRLAGRRVPAV